MVSNQKKKMLVAHKTIAGKSVRGGQGNGDRNRRIDDNVNQRIDIAVVPAGIGKNRNVIFECEIFRKQGKSAQYLVRRFKRH